MKITFTPMRQDVPLSLEKHGDVLTLNGEAFDFAPLSEGDTLPRAAVNCPWLASDVTRLNGEIHLTLILPHSASAPQDTLFPAPLTIATDGPIALPAFASPEPETEGQT